MNCKVCGAAVTVFHQANPKFGVTVPREFHDCRECGFLHQPFNTYKFETEESYKEGSDPAKFKRVGDGKRPGREYGMAKTAIEMLTSKTNVIKILIWGAGISKDHELLRREGYLVDITDFTNTQNSPYWKPIRDLNMKYYDVLVSSEVIEHYTKPVEDLQTQLSYIHNWGISVSGTNMRSSLPLEKTKYVWTPGHCNYWTGEAIIQASVYYNTVFAMPHPSVSPRKRFIFQTPSPKVERSIKGWLTQHPYPWSEHTYLRKK